MNKKHYRPGQIVLITGYPGRYFVNYQFGQTLSVAGIDSICPVTGVVHDTRLNAGFDWDRSFYVDVSDIVDTAS